MLPQIALIVTAFLFSYFGTSIIRHLAHRHEIMDVPNERSSHSESIPRGGGLAIVFATLCGIWFYVMWRAAGSVNPLILYTAGALLIVAISGLDDWRSQRASIRFAVHSVGALAAIIGFAYLDQAAWATLASKFGSPILFAVMFVWIVGFTNAYNFMDGIDGIAGGQALVGGLAWGVIGWFTSQPLILLIGLLLAVSSLGFLLHNWHPARIFMGDVGSAFLGYSFAVFPLYFISRKPSLGLAGLIAFVLPLWPFVFDSSFTFLRRLSRGENVFAAHRSHLYQRLVILGYGHRSVSLVYCGLALVGAVLAVGTTSRLPNILALAFAGLLLMALALWTFVVRQEYKTSVRLHSQTTSLADRT
jgi:UDP-N-acetylmuramyl pentapeptide phosphotransferase/UDP-N-acetylglucosamine-1-phosphate transferase